MEPIRIPTCEDPVDVRMALNEIARRLEYGTLYTAGDGIEIPAHVIAVDLAGTPGLDFTGGDLRVKVDAAGGANLARAVNLSTNGLAVKVDGATIGENGAQRLYVPAGGIGATELNQTATYDFTGGAVNVFTQLLANDTTLAASTAFVHDAMDDLGAAADLIFLHLDASNDPMTGDLHFGDNLGIVLGTGSDATLRYNGSDLVIDPCVVGTGRVVIGSGAAGVDYALAFNGETTDGALTWMEDEALFQFSAGLTVPALSRLYLDGGSDTYIFEAVANRIDLVAGGTTGFRMSSSNISLLLNTSFSIDREFIFGTGATTSGFGVKSAQTPDGFMLWVPSATNALIFCEYADRTFDFAHAVQTNPTLWIQSANQSTTEWTSLSHGVIATGAGDLALTPVAGANVKFGTYAALGAEVLSGYITIKDAAGNVRKLAVIA